MAFGNNIAERSRKTDLITQIQMSRCGVVGKAAAIETTTNYRRKTVKELEVLAKEAYAIYRATVEQADPKFLDSEVQAYEDRTRAALTA